MMSDTPKQFMMIAEKPILIRTMEKFSQCHIVLVLPETQIEYWRGLSRMYRAPQHQIVVGGASRTESVKNGLKMVPDDALVAIHDGVRPMVTKEMIEDTFAAAEEYGSGVPVVDCVDSIRHLGKAANRADFQLVQTPQTFRASEIKAAYEKVGNSVQTDDATVFEMAGNEVHLTKGLRSNIKITLPVDIKIAEALL